MKSEVPIEWGKNQFRVHGVNLKQTEKTHDFIRILNAQIEK